MSEMPHKPWGHSCSHFLLFAFWSFLLVTFEVFNSILTNREMLHSSTSVGDVEFQLNRAWAGPIQEKEGQEFHNGQCMA